MELVDSKKKMDSNSKKSQWKKTAISVAKEVGFALIVGAASAAGARAFNSIAQRTKTSADVIQLKKVM